MKQETKMNKPAVDPEEVFPQVEKMIYSCAWKFSKQYPITFEEAKSEAYFAFVKSCYDYKPESGSKFSTWCYYWVWCKLKDLITARSKDPLVCVEIDDDLCGEAVDLSEEFKQELAEIKLDLSDTANDILSLLLETPAELLEGVRPPTPRQLMIRAKRYLFAQGTDKCRLESAHKELEFQFKWAMV